MNTKTEIKVEQHKPGFMETLVKVEGGILFTAAGLEYLTFFQLLPAAVTLGVAYAAFKSI